MIITIKLPWYKSQFSGRDYDIVSINSQPSELDGEVCTEGKATSMLTGEVVKLPPYIAVEDVPNFIIAQLGQDHGANKITKLN